MSENTFASRISDYHFALKRCQAIIIPNIVMSLSTRQFSKLLLLLALVSVFCGISGAQPEVASDLGQFQHIEDNWSIAFVKKDQYAMELLLAPTFVNISAGGNVSTRNQTIAEMFDHSTGELLSMEQKAVNVRVLGDVALVDGTYVIHYKTGSHTFDERGVFTHVYQRTRANWTCLHAQRTAVFDQPDEKQKQASKKSGAVLPFHVPLIYKGAASSQSPPPPAADKQPNP